MRHSYLTTALIAGLLAAGAAQADAVVDWNDLANGVVPQPAGPRAYNAATYQADQKFALAVFEAADAVDRRYVSFLHVPAAPPHTSGPVAVATAAHDVLIALYPETASKTEDAYTLALAAEPDPAARDRGIATGHAASKAALAAGGTDPARKADFYWPASTPGEWVPTGLTTIDAHALTYRPWVIRSADQFRPAPPPALDSAVFRRDLAEIKQMGGKVAPMRSAADTARARFWAGYDTDAAVNQIASQPGRSLVRNARLYALMAVADHDIGLTLADGKLHYGYWRPVQAIRGGAAVPAVATLADPSWEPLLNTPNHPEYPCGHCAYAASTAALLAAEGPMPPGGVRFTNARLPGMTVTITNWGDYVRQVSFSRICGGVHYRHTAEITEAMARDATRYVLANFAPPIR